jgi:hypothetical protein
MGEKLFTLPALPLERIRTILVGLDELPGKFSRVLYDELVAHIDAQVRDEQRTNQTGRSALQEALGQSPRSVETGPGVVAPVGSDPGPPDSSGPTDLSGGDFPFIRSQVAGLPRP